MSTKILKSLSSPSVYLKDYYTILELPPSASFDEIKKAYRRLAHLYHPDKKENDVYAAAKFAEIKEAYETLTHPHKKDLYLQQRWYAQSMGRKKTGTLVTPEDLLKRVLELNKYIHTLDVHRMDKEGLYHYIIYILSDENIQILNSFEEPGINQEIIRLVLPNGLLIPYKSLDEFAKRLQQINVPEQPLTEIKEMIRQRKLSMFWEKWRVWIILLIVLLFCTGLFFISKN